MRPLTLYIQTILICVSFFSIVNANPLVISNKEWVLFKIIDLQARKEIFVDEYHFLKFGNGRVSFKIDCNICSDSCEFISRDSIYFRGYPMCTRKGCFDTDKIKIAYSGKYKIWKEGSYLIIRTNEGDHVYK